jgi:hypothetical protein
MRLLGTAGLEAGPGRRQGLTAGRRTIMLIVRRPAVDQREVLVACGLDYGAGLIDGSPARLRPGIRR